MSYLYKNLNTKIGIQVNSNTGTNHQILTSDGTITQWTTPILYYNSSGIFTPKIWVGTTTTNVATGIAIFDINTAGFSSITSVQATVKSSDAASTQTFCVVTASSTTSVSVTVYYVASSSVVVLGIPVIGSVGTAVYTAGTKTIDLLVVGI